MYFTPWLKEFPLKYTWYNFWSRSSSKEFNLEFWIAASWPIPQFPTHLMSKNVRQYTQHCDWFTFPVYLYFIYHFKYSEIWYKKVSLLLIISGFVIMSMHWLGLCQELNCMLFSLTVTLFSIMFSRFVFSLGLFRLWTNINENLHFDRFLLIICIQTFLGYWTKCWRKHLFIHTHCFYMDWELAVCAWNCQFQRHQFFMYVSVLANFPLLTWQQWTPPNVVINIHQRQHVTLLCCVFLFWGAIIS